MGSVQQCRRPCEVAANITWAAKSPRGIREASEDANCPRGHHLEQKRTKVERGSSTGGRAEDFSPRSLAPRRCPTHCLNKTAVLNCHRPLKPALHFWLIKRKRLFLRRKEGGPSRRRHSAGFFQSGSRRAAQRPAQSAEPARGREGSFPDRTRLLLRLRSVTWVRTLPAAGA